MPNEPASTGAAFNAPRPEPTSLPAATGRLLYRLSRGWVPPYTPSLRVIALQSGDIDIDVLASSIRLDGDRLLLECEIPGADLSRMGAALRELRRPSFSGWCEDGSKFSMRDAFVALKTTEDHLESLVQQVVVERVVVASQEWSITRSRTHAQLWVGVIDRELPHNCGNMRFSVEDSTAPYHYRLSGSTYVYYLICSRHSQGARWLIAVDAGGATELDRDILRDDVANIAFTFGRPFNLSVLHGLDEQGTPVDVFGSELGTRHTGRPRISPPVPEQDDTRGRHASFFGALSAGFAGSNGGLRDGLRRARKQFLEALNDRSADGFELKMLLGSTAAARLVLREGAALVEDAALWNEWISRNQDSIEKLACTGRAGELLAAVRRCERSGEAGLIRMALSHVGLALTADMGEAIDSTAGELSGGRVEERSTGERAAYLQTILVALVAKAIEYNGPICGWEERDLSDSYVSADPSYLYAAPSWWKVGDADTVAFFLVEIPEAEASRGVLDLWPYFNRPLQPVPSEGLIGLIALFAGELKARTGGLVAAAVQPIHRAQNKPSVFNFVLRSTIRRTASTVLFSIEDAGNGAIRITGWADSEHTLRTGVDVYAFLDNVAHRVETHTEVELMMLDAEPA